MKVIHYLLTEARKALFAGVAGAGALLSAGLLHGTVLLIVTALIAVAGSVGVHQATNAPAQPNEAGYGLVEIALFLLILAIALVVLNRNGLL